MDTDWDVIVAGASFAGLGAAVHLGGHLRGAPESLARSTGPRALGSRRILLLDKRPVGALQRSACATPLETLQALGLEEAVLQVHHKAWLHTPSADLDVPLRRPFCTFDYGRLCRALLERSGAEYRRCQVLGMTPEGRVRADACPPLHAKAVIDATGWRAVLAGSLGLRIERRHLGFAVEIAVARRDEDLHFFLDPAVIRGGLGWLFPSGDHCRVGIGSVSGRVAGMVQALRRFAGRYGEPLGRPHGGFIPYRPRPCTAGPLFLCGDSAGQCLPVAAEGIRASLYFGALCARHVRDLVEGRCTLDQAQAAYRQAVEAHRGTYRRLLRMQWLAHHLPVGLVTRLARRGVARGAFEPAMDAYLNRFSLGRAIGEPPLGA